jgi:hypothetical protein
LSIATACRKYLPSFFPLFKPKNDSAILRYPQKQKSSTREPGCFFEGLEFSEISFSSENLTL